MLVVEEQPDFLEGVAIVLRLPSHLLTSTGRSEIEFLPGQGVRSVVSVGALGVTGVAVDGDTDQVAGHRLGAGVAQ